MLNHSKLMRRLLGLLVAVSLAIAPISPVLAAEFEAGSERQKQTTRDQVTETGNTLTYRLPRNVVRSNTESSLFEDAVQDFWNPEAGSFSKWPALSDQRQLVTDFSNPINRSICRLSLYFKDQNGVYIPFVGTGFVIGDHSIVTSAHCLYDHEEKLGWIDRIVVEIPDDDVHGIYMEYDSDREDMDVQILKGYETQADDQLDLGLIRLSSSLQKRHGSIELATDIHQGNTVQAMGYPSDRKVDDLRRLYSMSGPVLSLEDRQIAAGVYSHGGQSGSPFLNDQGQAVGVLSFGLLSARDGKLRASAGPLIDSSWLSWLADNGAILAPVYRAYNPNSGEHVYTTHYHELTVLKQAGWHDEGLAWYSANDQAKPVFRIYNPVAGDHHYTTSTYEIAHLESVGWKAEGICWYLGASDPQIYRLYNPNAKTGTHHFTRNAGEAQSLAQCGWVLEGTLQ